MNRQEFIVLIGLLGWTYTPSRQRPIADSPEDTWTSPCGSYTIEGYRHCYKDWKYCGSHSSYERLLKFAKEVKNNG